MLLYLSKYCYRYYSLSTGLYSTQSILHYHVGTYDSQANAYFAPVNKHGPTIKAVERLNPSGGRSVPGAFGHVVQQIKCTNNTTEHYDSTPME